MHEFFKLLFLSKIKNNNLFNEKFLRYNVVKIYVAKNKLILY